MSHPRPSGAFQGLQEYCMEAGDCVLRQSVRRCPSRPAIRLIPIATDCNHAVKLYSVAIVGNTLASLNYEI